MKAINNFENVQATTGEFNRPSANGYIIEIIGVKDVPLDEATQKGDYLKIDYDIAAGEFKGYYTEQNEKFGGEWFASFIRSYKEKALGMFKHFTNCVEDSNAGYTWNWDEKSLVGKLVGVVMQEEEYIKKDGSIGTRLKVKDIKTVEQIRKGDFKIPPVKKVEQTASANATTNAQWEELSSDDSLPF
jgi:hypothetical protein